jgi:hypothetical protein
MGRRATATKDPDLSAVEVGVIAMGTFRLVRIITTDDFPPIELARARIIEWAGKDSALAKAISCPWCSSWWISLAVVALALRYPAARKALLVPAVSGAVGSARHRRRRDGEKRMTDFIGGLVTGLAAALFVFLILRGKGGMFV